MTFAIEFTAWRAVHLERSELRLGWITLWWCPGSASDEFYHTRIALIAAAHELRRAS